MSEIEGEELPDDGERDASKPERELSPEGHKDERAREHGSLASDLKTSREEAKKNYDLYVRSLAELDNFKKRITKEAEDNRKFANEDLIKALIPVIDNLDRALSHGEDEQNSGAILEGVKMVHKQLMDALVKYGVQEVAALGEPFDPNFHQALMQVKTNASPPNTVVSEISKGYLLNGRLIRPSMVGVSVKDEDAPQKDPDASEDSPWGDEEYVVEGKGNGEIKSARKLKDDDK
jgi:molecular chaperone GrpE